MTWKGKSSLIILFHQSIKKNYNADEEISILYLLRKKIFLFILPLDFSVPAELPSSNSWLPNNIIGEIKNNFIWSVKSSKLEFNTKLRFSGKIS